MNKKLMFLSLAGLFATGLFCGCNNARSLVEDPTISLQYLKEPTEDNLVNLSKAYGTAINRNRKSGVKQPGLCSEYAITLALLGNQEEANKWFNKEVADFPSSRDYVQQLKKTYCPAYVNDRSQANGAPVATMDGNQSGEDAAVQKVIDDDKAALAGDKGTDKPKKSTSSSKKGKKHPKKKPSKR